MERARTEWLRALGVDQVALMEQERRIFVVTETKAEFIVPARFNDEIVVTARLAGLTRATFDIEQNIYRNSLDGTLLLKGSVRAAYLNADTLRPKRVPASLFEGKTQ
jgi:acyl-CoA thioester hydrolase